MPTESSTARTLENREQSIQWDDDSPLTQTIRSPRTDVGEIRTRHGRFLGGLADGVEVVEINTSQLRVMVLPSRGMSIWYLEAGGIRFGWDSPVPGPVHPDRVPVLEPSGLGWLEGFHELVARCGLESNGAPEHDEQGRLRYPLHGRIGNLPATSLKLDYDEASGRVELIGEIYEARLFFKRLRLRSRVRVHAGLAKVELLDDVTNELASPATAQLLYHINVGTPVLGPGAALEAPVKEVAPKDAISANEIDQWTACGPPETGYAERVYFAQLHADDTESTTAMLRAADGASALAVEFNAEQLPRFIFWKNTAAESDGYVVGLEPATNYPNPHSFEAEQGRVVTIPAGETASFRVSLHPLSDAEAVEQMSEKIRALSAQQPAEVHREPKPGWSI